MSAFKNALEKVGNAIKDATSLDVVTVSGKFEADRWDDQKEGNVKLKWDEIVKNAVQGKGDFKLVGAYYHSVDYDVVQFLTNDPDLADKEELIALHKATIDSSVENRRAILELLGKLI